MQSTCRRPGPLADRRTREISQAWSVFTGLTEFFVLFPPTSACFLLNHHLPSSPQFFPPILACIRLTKKKKKKKSFVLPQPLPFLFPFLRGQALWNPAVLFLRHHLQSNAGSHWSGPAHQCYPKHRPLNFSAAFECGSHPPLPGPWGHQPPMALLVH